MTLKLTKRCLAFIIAAVIALAGSSSFPFLPAEASSEQELKKQLEDHQKKINEINNKLKNLEKDQGNQESYQVELSEKIRLMQQHIGSLNGQIFNLDSEINNLSLEIIEKQNEINDRLELFRRRLRAMSMNDSAGYLEMIFGSSSFADFVMHTETLKRVSKHDSDLVKKLTDDKKIIEENLKKVEDKKASIEILRLSAQSEKSQLDEAYSKSSEIMASLEKMERMFRDQRAEIESEQRSIQDELNRFLLENLDTGGLVSGNWLWPVPGFSYISSPYGYRTWSSGYTEFHTGIDIAGGNIHNAKIVAANSGIVKRVILSYTPNVGYGRYLIIDHGGSYSTLYAHCEIILVSEGQAVTAGQEIARVGTTGRSTGYHLHFEVRIGTAFQDPRGYVKY